MMSTKMKNFSKPKSDLFHVHVCTISWSIFFTQAKRLPSTAFGDFVWEKGSSNTSGVPLHWSSRRGDYFLPASLLLFQYCILRTIRRYFFCLWSKAHNVWSRSTYRRLEVRKSLKNSIINLGFIHLNLVVWLNVTLLKFLFIFIKCRFHSVIC